MLPTTTISDYLRLLPVDERIDDAVKTVQGQFGRQIFEAEQERMRLKHRARYFLIAAVPLATICGFGAGSIAAAVSEAASPIPVGLFAGVIVLALLVACAASDKDLFRAERERDIAVAAAKREASRSYREDADLQLSRVLGAVTRVRLSDLREVIAAPGVFLLVNWSNDSLAELTPDVITHIEVRSHAAFTGTLSSTSQPSAGVLGTALAGGLLFGGAGAVVGAIAAASHQESESAVQITQSSAWYIDLDTTLDDPAFIRIGPFEDEVHARSLVARFRQPRPSRTN